MNNNKKITGKILASVVAAGIMSFCGVLVETAMNVTFPTLMKEFNVDTATVQWMTTGCLLIVAVIVPLSATVKKNFSTKAIFLAGNLFFMIGAIMDAAAPNFPILLIGRMIQGVGTGLALPLMFNIILEQVPPQKIGLMMGVGSLITAVAPAISPTYGGLVVNSLGWRYIFILLLPILIVSLIMGLSSIEQVSSVKRTPVDFLSILSIFLLFGGLILGFSNFGNSPLLSLNVLGAWVVGILGLFLLLYRYRVATPIINLGVLKNKRFAGHVISFFFFQIGSLGLSFILPYYIQIVNHQSASIAGLVVLPGAALGAIFAPFGGQILDRLGARKPILTGISCSVIGLLLFTIFSRSMSSTMISIFYLIYMAGTGLAFGNIMTSGLQNLTVEEQVDGNAILTTFQQFAGAAGTSIVSAIISQSQNQQNVSRAVSTANGSFNALVVLLILAVIEFIILNRVVVNNQKSDL